LLLNRWVHGVFKQKEQFEEVPGFVTENGRLTFIGRVLENTNKEIDEIARYFYLINKNNFRFEFF